MNLLEIVILCIAVAVNNLVVSTGLGSMGQYEKRWRIVSVFGFFEFTIPLIGLFFGQLISALVNDIAGFVSAGIIISMGIIVIINTVLSRRDIEEVAKKLTTLKGLVLLAMGLSADNLAIGFGLGLSDNNPFLIAGLISLFSMGFSYAGLHMGHKGKHINDKAAGIISGGALIGIGVYQLVRMIV